VDEFDTVNWADVDSANKIDFPPPPPFIQPAPKQEMARKTSGVLIQIVKGPKWTVQKDTIIGRKPFFINNVPINLIKFDDERKTVSKNHALIRVTDSVPTIIDLKSTNGTYLVTPDKKLRLRPEVEYAVKDESVFQIGAILFKVKYLTKELK
jgi:pSer/pThr/pTyr-binding forkhead associated (FHA) protein